MGRMDGTVRFRRLGPDWQQELTSVVTVNSRAAQPEWELVVLADGLVLMVDAERSPGLLRSADVAVRMTTRRIGGSHLEAKRRGMNQVAFAAILGRLVSVCADRVESSGEDGSESEQHAHDVRDAIHSL
jgi:hypothetical protein